MKNFKKINIFSLLTIISLLFISPLAAEILLNKNFNSFKLELESNNDSVLFRVSGKNKQPQVLDLFELQNPNRIVLDVSNINATSNTNYAVAKNSEIKKIRIGKHSQKVRFVLDLEDGEIPKFNVLNSTGNNLIVKLNKNTPMAKKAEKNIVQENKAPSINQALPSNQIVNKPVVQQNARQVVEKKNIIPTLKEPTSEPKAKIAKKEIEEISGDQGLENIKFYFKKDKKTPLVRFMFVKKPKYTIKKKSDKKYLLTIKNARIRWPHLELPQFPPRDFRGFTMIMPSIKNGNLEIVIGVERGSKVTSFTKDNEVWLKVENYS